MATQIRLMTAAELEELPDDGWRYELVEGELRKMPPAGGEHGRIGVNLLGPMWAFVTPGKLGILYSLETGFLVARDPDTVLVPDIAFVRAERAAPLGRISKYIPFAPDLAVEVVSPTDRYTDVAEKIALWLAAGTALVWVVDPRHDTVTVHRRPSQSVTLTAADTLDGGDVLPGWTLPVRDIFTP